MTSQRKRQNKTREFKVVFDTSVLYTGSASDFLKPEVVELIASNSQHSDLSISWYIPEIVMHERQFQMQGRGFELLPPVQKLERLLGHNLNITEDIIRARVREVIERQRTEIGLSIIPLRIADVDWNRVMLDAAYRRPPFEAGDKEKGFRDALIAETFLQLVSESPVTPKVCRIALVTGDKLLAETISARTADATNVRVLESLEELKSLINTLATEVSEEFVAKIQDKARSYFFESKQENALYYKERIADRIREKFSSELHSTPPGADRRENDTWHIQSPRFVRKDGQRVHWVTRITVEAKSYKTVPFISGSGFSAGSHELQLPTGTYVGVAATPFAPLSQIGAQDLYASSGSLSIGSGLPTRRENLFKTGQIVFEVTWSVSITTKLKFSAPRIEGLEHIETLWE